MKGPKLHRIAIGLLVLACLWFAFVSLYGSFGRVGGGHNFGGAAGTAMMAEQMIRWKTLYPSWAWYEPHAPGLTQAYCHHPHGMYWLSVFSLGIFGHRDFAVFLPAVVQSILTPPLFYAIFRRVWGVVPAATIACAYVVIPVAIGFANFHNCEVMCIFGGLAFFWGLIRYEESSKRRWLLVMLTGAWWTTSAEWEGFLVVGFVLGVLFLTRFVLPGLSPRFPKVATAARSWALTAGLSVFGFVFWMALFQHANMLADFLQSGAVRSGGSDAKLSVVLASRADWIDFAFTPPVIWFGKFTAIVAVIRLVILRKTEETFGLAFLFAATIHYLAFKQGADVHTFWTHYFAPFAAIGMGTLAVSVREIVSFIMRFFRGPVWVSGWAALVVGIVPSLVVLPDGIRSLRIWRETGGRYNDKGTALRNQADSILVTEEVLRPHHHAGKKIHIHDSVGWEWEHLWALFGKPENEHSPVPTIFGPNEVWMGRSSGLTGDEVKKIVSGVSARVYGDLWVVDRSKREPGLEVFAIDEKAPNLFESLVLGAYQPVRTLSQFQDGLRSWEWNYLLDRASPPPPLVAKSLEEKRIIYNYQKSLGDASSATTLNEITSALHPNVRATFEGGLRLLGVRTHVGPEQRIQVWFIAPEKNLGEIAFAMTAKMIESNRFSLFPLDPTVRGLFTVGSIPTSLWKPGHIYMIEVPMLRRVGTEVFSGYWVSRGGTVPRRLDGPDNIELAVVP